MEIHIFLKGKKEPIIFTGDRVEVLDFEMNSVKYKQVRRYRKGFSKSEYIQSSLVDNIKEIN